MKWRLCSSSWMKPFFYKNTVTIWFLGIRFPGPFKGWALVLWRYLTFISSFICTHLYVHLYCITSFRYLSIPCNSFLACVQLQQHPFGSVNLIVGHSRPILVNLVYIRVATSYLKIYHRWTGCYYIWAI